MSFRLFGSSAARLLRTAAAPASASVTTANATSAALATVGGAIGGGTGGVAAILLLAASSLSLLASSENAEGGGGIEDEDAKLSTADSYSPTSGAFSRLVYLNTITTMTKIPTTMCEADPSIAKELKERRRQRKDNTSLGVGNKGDDDAESDTAEAEAALTSTTTATTEELKERREQRKKFKNQNLRKTRRRMTNVGRFSLVSETAQNPSVPVLVLAMTGQPYYAKDFRRLYREKKVAEKHPRFNARLDETKTHFEFDNNNEDIGNDSDDESDGDNDISDDSDDYDNKDNKKDSNVRDVLFPAIPVAELKDRVNDASLYDPLDLNSRLWEAWTATGGSIGQSGAITSNTNISQARDSNDKSNNVVESLLLFRAHHCMADGVSLGALFGDLMDEGPDIQEEIQRQIIIHKKKKQGTPWWKKLLFFLYYWMWGTIKALMYQLYLFSISWYDSYEHDDPWVILKSLYDEKRKRKSSKGHKQEVRPRSLSWATVAPVDEVKQVATFYSKQQNRQNGKKSRITINDVFCSCVSAAIVKQLSYHRAVNPQLSPSLSSSSSTTKQLSLPSMNLIIPVHLQGGMLLPGQSMGNKIGAMVTRIPGEHLGSSKNCGNSTRNNNNTDDNPALLAQERLIQVHTVLNERKQTPVAVLSYLMAGVMGYLSSSSSSSSPGDNHSTSNTNITTYSAGSSSSSWTPWLFRKAHANASVVVTNVRGSESLVHLEGRPIRAFLGFLPLPAGVPVGLVVGSYNNEITLTVTAEEYAVPDADKFLGWVRDEYELLKRRADDEAAAVATE